MGWLKRAASSVKNAMGLATIQTTKRTARTARRITVLDGEATTEGPRRRNRNKKYSDIRCCNSRKVQSPGNSSAASKGCPGFAKLSGKNGEGDVAHAFFREDYAEERTSFEPSRRVKSGTFLPMRVKDGNVEMFRRNL